MFDIKYIAYVIIVIFFALDFFLRKGKTATTLKKTKDDNNSTKFLIICFFAILFGSEILKANNLGVFNNPALSIIALCLMIVGLTIRIISIKTLNESYTRTLTTLDKQKLIRNGIYKFIRHPGYFGTILIWSFYGLAISNYWVSILGFVLLIVAYSYRIKQEEKMLVENFGEEYLDYMKNSKRLIPFIF